jgi:saccharopine dehydrogenase-like NADP-dependent oxidoreductase
MQSLDKFCKKCDLVINCAGPSRLISDRISLASLRQKKHYVDVAGDEPLYEKLLDNKEEIKSKKLNFILSAGILPGLYGVFPDYIANTEFDSIDSFKYYWAGEGSLSFSAAYDYVCSIEEGFGVVSSYFDMGEVKKIKEGFSESIILPSPVGEVCIYSVLTPEFIRVARKYQIKSAYAYNAYRDKSDLDVMISIGVLKQYQTDEQKSTSARRLTELFDSRKHSTPVFSMFHLIAAGLKNNKHVKLVSTLFFNDGDGNALSGIVAGITAKLIIDGETNGTGCSFLPEGINANKMMELLETQNVVLEKKYTDLNMIQGVI